MTISPMWRAEARPSVRGEEKSVCAHPRWDSVGLRCNLLPTKTSRMLILLFRRSPSLDNTCSQVFTMRLVDPFFRFYIGVGGCYVTIVSLMFIARSHLARSV